MNILAVCKKTCFQQQQCADSESIFCLWSRIALALCSMQLAHNIKFLRNYRMTCFSVQNITHRHPKNGNKTLDCQIIIWLINASSSVSNSMEITADHQVILRRQDFQECVSSDWLDPMTHFKAVGENQKSRLHFLWSEILASRGNMT